MVIEATHLEATQKRTFATMPPDKLGETEVAPLIRVLSSPKKPLDSFSAVPYRNHWYYIDDQDLRSKSMFTLLMFIFSLTEAEGREGALIVTIPAG